MSFLGKTFDRWIKYRIVQVGLLLIILTIFFLFIPIYSKALFQDFGILLEFWVEIIAVVCALIFGFYWDRAHEYIERLNKLDGLISMFIVELQENKEKIPKLFLKGRGDYFFYSPKTTVWEVYKEELGAYDLDLVYDLT